MRSAGAPRARLAGGQSERSGAWLSRVCRIVQPFARKVPISAATVGMISIDRLEIVAERLAEAAGLEKVALHVDHDERGAGGIEAVRERLGGDFDHRCKLIAPRFPETLAAGVSKDVSAPAGASFETRRLQRRSSGRGRSVGRELITQCPAMWRPIVVRSAPAPSVR